MRRNAMRGDGTQIGVRGILALLGGYGVAAISQAMLARALPMTRIDATIVATMLSFIVFVAAVVWSFAARTVVGAVMGLGAASAFSMTLWSMLR